MVTVKMVDCMGSPPFCRGIGQKKTPRAGAEGEFVDKGF